MRARSRILNDSTNVDVQHILSKVTGLAPRSFFHRGLHSPCLLSPGRQKSAASRPAWIFKNPADMPPIRRSDSASAAFGSLNGRCMPSARVPLHAVHAACRLDFPTSLVTVFPPPSSCFPRFPSPPRIPPCGGGFPCRHSWIFKNPPDLFFRCAGTAAEPVSIGCRPAPRPASRPGCADGWPGGATDPGLPLLGCSSTSLVTAFPHPLFFHRGYRSSACLLLDDGNRRLPVLIFKNQPTLFFFGLPTLESDSFPLLQLGTGSSVWLADQGCFPTSLVTVFPPPVFVSLWFPFPLSAPIWTTKIGGFQS